MTYRFFIIVILLYGVTFNSLRKIYSIDSDSFKIAKILNIIITLLMTWYITGQGNTILEIFTDFKAFKSNYQIDAGLINENLTLIAKIIHNILNFFMIFVVFQLIRRNGDYRKIFIYLIPLLTILMTLEVNREYYRDYSNDNPGLFLIVALIITLIKFIPLFFIYNSKVFKRFMYFNDKKIKDLVLKDDNNGSAQHTI